MKLEPAFGAARTSNEGELELFFIGTGTAFAGELGHTSILVTKGSDHLLIDCGTSVPERIHSIAGLRPQDIQTILPTHQHADHVGGLEYFCIEHRYRPDDPDSRTVGLFLTEELRRTLWHFTLKGGLGFNEPGMNGDESLMNLYFQITHPEESVRGNRKIWKGTVGGIGIELFETAHVEGLPDTNGMMFRSYGVIIDDRIFFSADSRFDREIIELYSGSVDWFFHDTGLQRTPLHASLEELRSLPPELTSRFFLTHYPEEAVSIPVDDFAGWARPGMRYLVDRDE